MKNPWKVAAALVCFAALAAVPDACAQPAGSPVTIEYYYKLVPGAMTPGGGGE